MKPLSQTNNQPRQLKKIQALGRLKQGQMNKTEQAYANHLETLKTAGDIVYYTFDGINLRLADNTFYKPDFLVMKANGELQIHEVKGYWQDDAKVKIKVASSLYPFKFLAVYKTPKKQGGGWQYEEY